jgi:hypothetical protein
MNKEITWMSSVKKIPSSSLATKQNNNGRTILQGKETGQWLLVLPCMVNGTKLLAQE